MADDFDPKAYLKSKGVSDDSDFDPKAYVESIGKPKPVEAPKAPPLKFAGPGDMGFMASVATGAQDVLPLGHKSSAYIAAMEEDGHDPKKSMDQLYNQNLAFQDQATAATQEAHPVGKWIGRGLGTAAQIATFMVGAPARAAAAVAPSFWGGMGKAVVSGAPVNAALGAASGFDNARGDWAHNGLEAAKAAALSTALGIPLNVAGYLISKGIGAGINALRGGVQKTEDGIIAKSVDTVPSKNDFDASVLEKVQARKDAGLDSWGKGGPSSNITDVPPGLEETASRQGRMAAKVGRDVRQAHAILSNPDAFSPADVAAARKVAQQSPEGFRGLPNPRAASKNVQASASGENTEVMRSSEIAGNIKRGGDLPGGPPAVPAEWDGKALAPVPARQPGAERYIGAFREAPGAPVESPLPEMKRFNPEANTAAEGPGNPARNRPGIAWKPGEVVPEGQTGQGIDELVRQKQLQDALAAGYGGTPASKGQVVAGAIRGGFDKAYKGAVPAMGLGHFLPHVAEAAEGLGTAYGAAKGGLSALSPAQRINAMRSAQSMLQNPKTRAMGYALMRSMTEGDAQGAGAATGSDENRSTDPHDERQP